MVRQPGLYWTGLVLALFGVLFYLTSVLGIFWPKPTPANDIGLYVTTAAFVGFGLATLLLWYTKTHPGSVD